MAGARSLWRATGMTDADFEKPIVAIANSFTQFVPGHVHLHDVGQRVKKVIDAAGGWGVEFNTIAVDDGIAMGHGGMLYSLPSRDLIADSVEYMVNAHCADALVCISNCDKITPGMLMAAMRLNIPTIFVSGGPMEAGKMVGTHDRDGKPLVRKLDLIDSMIASRRRQGERRGAGRDGALGVPDLRLVLGHVHRQQHELPQRGARPGAARQRHAAGDARAPLGAVRGGRRAASSSWRSATTSTATTSVLPRSIATFEAFENAMTLDIAMGGSTNTVLHILAIAHEAGVDFTMAGHRSPVAQGAQHLQGRAVVAATTSRTCTARAASSRSWASSTAPGSSIATRGTVHAATMGEAIDANDLRRPTATPAAKQRALAAPGGVPTQVAFSQDKYFADADLDVAKGCIRDVEHAYSKDGGLAVLYGNIALEGCIVKTAGVDASIWKFEGPARVFHSQDAACDAIMADQIVAGDVVVIVYEGPKGGPGHAGDALPDVVPQGQGARQGLRAGHRRPLLRAAPRASASATSRPRRPRAAPSASSRRATASASTSRRRRIDVVVDDATLARRRAAMDAKGADGWRPNRDRFVSEALQAYALMTTSAARGAVPLN